MTFCYYVDNINNVQSVEDKKPEIVSELKGDGTGGEFVCVFVLIVSINTDRQYLIATTNDYCYTYEYSNIVILVITTLIGA